MADILVQLLTEIEENKSYRLYIVELTNRKRILAESNARNHEKLHF